MAKGLMEELQAGWDNEAELRSLFERHATSADLPPRHLESRTIAEDLAERDPERAVQVLLAALEDLRRFFPLRGTDEARERDQMAVWEAWALGRCLRRVVLALEEEEKRERTRQTLQALDAPPTSGWAKLMDPAQVRRDEGPEPGEWGTFESGVYAFVSEAAGIEITASLKAVKRILRPGPALEDAFEQLEVLRTVAARLKKEQRSRPRAHIALLGLVDAQRLDKNAALLGPPVSPELRSLVEEYRRAARTDLTGAIDRGGTELRGEIRRASLSLEDEARADVYALLGISDVDAAEELQLLRQERSRTRKGSDARAEVDRRLVEQFREELERQELLDIFREHGWIGEAAECFVPRGDLKEFVPVLDEALAKLKDERSAPDWAVPVSSVLQEHSHFDRAERLLRRFVGDDPHCAQEFARCLDRQSKEEALGAFADWFRIAPTLETYLAIGEALGAERFETLRRELYDFVCGRSIYTTAIEIAVSAADVEAIEALLPNLNGNTIDFARQRIKKAGLKLSVASMKALVPRASQPPSRQDRNSVPIFTQSEATPSTVHHKKFGLGRVLNAEGQGDQRKLTIEFDEHGTKTLLARFVSPADP